MALELYLVKEMAKYIGGEFWIRGERVWFAKKDKRTVSHALNVAPSLQANAFLDLDARLQHEWHPDKFSLEEMDHPETHSSSNDRSLASPSYKPDCP
jgi:hypothetical protein